MRKKIILAISLSLLIVALCTAILILGRNMVKQGGENTTSKNEDNKEVITIHGEDGITPHIGENGNWWLGSYDTGVRAEGIDGKDGTNGKDGKDGINGVDGKNGKDGADGKDGKNGLDGINGKDGVDGIGGITPHIGENGNWYFGNADTGIRAEGTNGKDGINGTDGVDGINGKDGADGKDGINGITPHVGDNGNWWLGEDDTGILAVGTNGKDGTDGATPAIKNGTWWIGGVDTGFVAIGKDGKDGENGKNGKDGATPYISGNTWWIDGEDTGIVAKGQDGNDGENGNGIVDIKIEEGILYLMFSETEGTWTEIGKIVAEVTAPTEENALDFYLLPDGTYGVTAGKQLYFDTITIPEKHLDKTVSTILTEAFSGAANLNKIEIPSSVTEIGENAFLNCKKLEKIVISEYVSKIGKNAFTGCEMLTICAVASSAPGGWDSDYNPDGCPVIWSYDSDIKTSSGGLRYKITDENEIKVLGYTGDSYQLVIPEAIDGVAVKAIGQDAFYGNSDILSVTLPATLTEIGSGAFKNCYRLTEIYNLTDMELALGDEGFGGIAKYAKKIHKSMEDESILKEDALGFVYINDESKYKLVYYSGEDSNLVLPDNFGGESYMVGDYALYGMDKLESITVSANVTAIGNYAFAECVNVTSFYFGAKSVAMLSAESRAFCGLGRETDGVAVTIGIEVSNLPAYLFATDSDSMENSPNIKSVLFENGSSCKSIGTCAFLNATALESINIPDSVGKIEAKAFLGCKYLTSVVAAGLFFANDENAIYFDTNYEQNAAYLTSTHVNMEFVRQ
ncbi:MAG: leucine-rich repeat protein [Clostridia bacterium]|nr:leucine-rich repeat protein [Clostridia bacterium]